MTMFESYWKRVPECPAWMSIFLDPRDQSWDPDAYRDAVAVLSQLSLLQSYDKADDGLCPEDCDSEVCITLHPLVRDWIQFRLERGDRERYCVQSMMIVESCINMEEDNVTALALDVRRALLTHLDAILELRAQYLRDWTDTDSGRLRDCFQTFVAFYKHEGRYLEAHATCRILLDAVHRAHGKDCAEGVTIEIELGDICLLQGRYKEVEQSLLHVLSSKTTQLSIVQYLHLKKALGKSFLKQGRYEEARAHLADALQQIQAHAPELQDELQDVQEILAQVYRNQGNHEDALALYRTVLSAYQASSKPSSAKAWKCMVHLANEYRAKSQGEQAAELYEHALKAFTQKFGSDHPSTLSTRLYSAINASAMSYYVEAEPAFHDVIERSRKVLGPQHPDTLKAVNDLAVLLDRIGRLEEAEAMYRTALVGREATLGLGNPYTLRTVERLVGLLWVRGKGEEAELLSTRGLKRQRRESCDDRPRIVEIAMTSATSTGPYRSRASELMLRRALESAQAELDSSHVDIADILRALKGLYEVQGRDDEAAALLTSSRCGADIYEPT